MKSGFAICGTGLRQPRPLRLIPGKDERLLGINAGGLHPLRAPHPPATGLFRHSQACQLQIRWQYLLHNNTLCLHSYSFKIKHILELF